MEEFNRFINLLYSALSIARQNEYAGKYEHDLGDIYDSACSEYYSHENEGSELEKDYAAKTGKPLITDNERTALGDLAKIIGKRPGDDQLEIF